jgi:hypothetical protein
MSIGPLDVADYLRWLADQPDGVRHRGWLYHAALIIRRNHETIFSARTPQTPHDIPGACRTGETIQERHGDQAI